MREDSSEASIAKVPNVQKEFEPPDLNSETPSPTHSRPADTWLSSVFRCSRPAEHMLLHPETARTASLSMRLKNQGDLIDSSSNSPQFYRIYIVRGHICPKIKELPKVRYPAIS